MGLTGGADAEQSEGSKEVPNSRAGTTRGAFRIIIVVE